MANHIKTHSQGGWKATLAMLLKEYGRYTADGHKVVSFATSQARRENLYKVFKDIRELGYKIKNVKNITTKHINALAIYYEGRLKEGSLSPATIKNRFSHLRTFVSWLNKGGLVEPVDRYITNFNIKIKRVTNAYKSNAWIDNGVNPREKIEAIRQENRNIGDALLLQLLFGLRTKESLLIRPHLADKKHVLIITHGAKGGRDRFIPIETVEQREILDRIKSYVGINESLVNHSYTYECIRRQYYRILKKYGICRKNGITAHGLRHQHLNDLYERVTGEKTPVRGGSLISSNKELDSFGRKLVSERAGHSRESIAGAYIGGKRIAVFDKEE